MRKAIHERNTLETQIKVSLNLDGTGKANINTGIKFFDHMLNQISTHSLIDLEILAKGDTDIDCHHLIEDVGITLGVALKKALGDKFGINRYGNAIIPMDETLVLCAIDISNRGYANIDDRFTMKTLGEFQTEMVKEFFTSLANNAGFNIQTIIFRGSNNHHMVEGTFKAFARALMEAIQINDRFGLPTSKGVL